MKGKRPYIAIALVLLAGLSVMLVDPVLRHVRAARLLIAMQAEDRTVPPVPGEVVTDLSSSQGQRIPARVYGPPAKSAHLCVVLGHGIHHKGIEEPRLIRFARHLEGQGVRVLTPKLSDLADYRITETGIDILRGSVARMAEQCDAVGLIGFSFAGGLALLAARESATAQKLKYVASIGGYHDLARTLRFLATNEVETLHGPEKRKAHEYGLLVLLYGHLDYFDLGADKTTLERALRAWLEEARPRAEEHAKAIETKEGQRIFSLVRAGRLHELSTLVLPIIEKRQTDLQRLSPRGHLKTLRTPLVLLHGSGDSVVPPEETLFASSELMQGGSPRHSALVTPLLEHVRVDKEAGLKEQWKLVHLVAQLF